MLETVPVATRQGEAQAVKIREVLQSKGSSVITTDPTVSVGSAVKRLHDAHIGALVVSRDGQHIDGILSERDIVNALAGDPAALKSTVGSVMTTEVLTIEATDSVVHAMTLMTAKRCRHLPVVRDGRLVGLISIGDLVKARLEELELESRVLRDIVLASH